MSYEVETKNAYRNKGKARAYQDQYIKGAKWARFTMWRQKGLIKRLLDSCNISNNDKILDAPCGTGYIGNILSQYKSSIVASDISLEMMELANNEYCNNSFLGFVQSDITQLPFPDKEFKCVIVLALMHRLPKNIRENVLSEISRVSNRFIVISYSVENVGQRLKRWVLLKIKRSHVPAPASIPLKTIYNELSAAGLSVIKMKYIAYFLSAKVVFFVDKEKAVNNET